MLQEHKRKQDFFKKKKTVWPKGINYNLTRWMHIEL